MTVNVQFPAAIFWGYCKWVNLRFKQSIFFRRACALYDPAYTPPSV